ncbi:hypothetical protein HF086_016804 [Spodoptera exigua]|uniref:FAD/NAD(P)-binding domain-containing protein n=1 Tax=Spodoptera exigua TaxID=7107 RepID=A0A922SIM9_SPOEX|nr:hypothetical protein HF086_016804 [Spodoptera exigua]
MSVLGFGGSHEGQAYRMYLWREMQEVASDKVVYRLKILSSVHPVPYIKLNLIWTGRPRRKIKRPYHDRDLPACVQYLIVGTGAAGWAAYRAIMEHDKYAKVFFITKEDSVPYQRPPLSKEMWLNPEPPDPKVMAYVQDDRKKTKVKEAQHVTVIGAGPLGCELAWHLGRMNKTFPREDAPPLELVHVYKDKGILSGILPEYLGVWAAEHIKCEGVKLVPNGTCT